MYWEDTFMFKKSIGQRPGHDKPSHPRLNFPNFIGRSLRPRSSFILALDCAHIKAQKPYIILV